MRTTNVSTLFPDDTARARKTDPLTSHEAADSNKTRLLVEAVVFNLLSKKPMTDEELTDAYDFGDFPPAHIDSPRKRRSGLSKRGALCIVGKSKSASGRATNIWGVNADASYLVALGSVVGGIA
jgi:hypothetical protein